MRWQKPFHHIPVDDYLNTEEYKLAMGLGLDYEHRLNSGIGPHERRYLNLMIAGLKPISMLDDHEFEHPVWQEAIKTHGWSHCSRDWIIRGNKFTEYYVYYPGLDRRVEILIRELGKDRSDLNETRIGYLLGYTKECIAYYTHRKKIMMASGMTLRLSVDIPDGFLESKGYRVHSS
jgi:hypothetical protein